VNQIARVGNMILKHTEHSHVDNGYHLSKLNVSCVSVVLVHLLDYVV
jgi:hypothetical protein